MKVVLLLAVLPLIWANQCSRNQYWSDDLNACLSCSKCKRNQMAIHPCGTHRDTECSTAVQSKLDISWLDDGKNNDIFELSEDADSKNVKGARGKKNRAHHLLKLSSASDDDDDIYQDFLQSKHDGGGKKKEKSNKKHKKHHYKFNQRINDKFAKWEDYVTTTKRPVRNRLVFDPYNEAHRHFSFPANWEEDVGKTKGDRPGKLAKALHDQRKLKNIYAEKELEEWLVLSEKELAQRKDFLLKNIKKDEYETQKNSSQKVKLSYPLYNTENKLMGAAIGGNNHLDDSANEMHKSTINDDVLNELIKVDEESKFEIETLMSNKNDLLYRGSTANRQMFAGEPSTVSEIIGQVKRQDGVDARGRSVDEVASRQLTDGGAVAAVPFTAVERFVWDWQELALISAVSACLLFFLVVTVYSIAHSSYQHKRAKSMPYTADMEEMSTRIALMQPTLETSSSEGITLAKFPLSAVQKS